MVLFMLIELAVSAVVVLFLFTQIILPAALDEPIFPLFRKPTNRRK